MTSTPREPWHGSQTSDSTRRSRSVLRRVPWMRPGYISTASVLVLSSVMLFMVASAFRFSVQSQDVQKKAQVRIDYTQREQALLRSVIGEVTNGAMRCMMSDSNSSDWKTPSRWRWIFENSRLKADGETALENTERSVLGIAEAAISGNTGDGSQDHVVNNVTATVSQSSEHLFYINSGTNNIGSSLGDGYPEALVLADTNLEKRDRDRPIITLDKTYANGSQFKTLPYPNVHFGYSMQGQTFVAKRNWWAFSMDYGKTSAGQTGVQTVRRNYVLSIYEIPSQLGLSSTAMTALGKHSDGTAWANVSIQGPVFGSEIVTEGALSLDQLAVRRGATIGESTTIGGATPTALTDREAYESAHSAFVPLSSSADSGLVTFVPINRGELAFDALTDTTDLNSASPTGWNYYSRPALQCVMNLRVEDVYSSTEQIPTSISFTYKVGGIDTTETFTAGVNWPSESSTEGAAFPFHLEETPYGRQGIAVYSGRLADYLSSVGADPLSVNSSLLVDANYRDNADIARPNIPSLSSDICLILRDSKDLTMFPNGMSIVTPFRLYMAGDVNLVASGLDSNGNEVYPPLSMFAPEKRFGLRKEAVTIRFEGQINHVGKDTTASARPLDLSSGENEAVVTDNIFADLYSIKSPAQLPPINQMNWMIVIEEVQ